MSAAGGRQWNMVAYGELHTKSACDLVFGQVLRAKRTAGTTYLLGSRKYIARILGTLSKSNGKVPTCDVSCLCGGQDQSCPGSLEGIQSVIPATRNRTPHLLLNSVFV